MVLNLRLMERAEYAVHSAFGSCEAFERFLNENTCWLFEQAERRYLNSKWVEYPASTVLLAGNCKIVLARPRPSADNFWNEIRYVILTVLTARRDDRVEALKAQEVDEPIRVFNHSLLPAGLTDTRTTLQQPAPARPAEQLKTEQRRTPTPAQRLLDRIEQGATAYYCKITSNLVAGSKPDAPCEACKEPRTPGTHPLVSTILRRGKANTPYYCETAGTLILGDEAMRYCEFCGEPSGTHKLTHIPNEKAVTGHNDATTAARQEGEGETKDKQHFIITAVCPECNTNLAPGRGAYCQHCGRKLPSDLAVHPEVVVAIKRSAYDKLATHLKQKVNVAWSQLLRGRRVDKSLNSMGQTLFIITVQDEKRTSSQTDEERLDSILTETNAGRVANDPYELREAHRMMDRKPPAQPA
jgi:rubrerythrin